MSRVAVQEFPEAFIPVDEHEGVQDIPEGLREIMTNASIVPSGTEGEADESALTMSERAHVREKGEKAFEDMTRLTAELEDEMTAFGLNVEQFHCVAMMWNHAFGKERSFVSMNELMETYWGDDLNFFDHIDTLLSLVNAGIIDIRGMETDGRSDEDVAAAIARGELTADALVRAENCRLSVSADFAQRIASRDSGIPFGDMYAPYTSNEEYLRDLFFLIEKLQSSNGFQAMLPGMKSDSVLAAAKAENMLKRRSENSVVHLPLPAFAAAENLCAEEFLIIASLLYAETKGMTMGREQMISNLASSDRRQGDLRRFLLEDSRLLRSGMIVRVESDRFRSYHDVEYALSPMLTDVFLGVDGLNPTQRLQAYVARTNMFVLAESLHTMEDVILPQSTRDVVTTSLRRYDRGVNDRLQAWGVYRHRRAAGTIRQPRLVMLFHGEPGTGKTHLAYGLAKSLGRELLCADISRVLGHHVGESEKNTRAIFRHFRQASSMLSTPPILLLNECDQFLFRRSDSQSSVDRMYHQMQDILLEELESFEGICIMTTNVVDTIDSAFSRRIDVKIPFDRPSAEQRRELWRHHLPATLPLAADVDIETIALDFDLTGGQIAVIVENAATEAAASECDEPMVTDDILRRYIDLEVCGQFEMRRRTRLGF